MRRLLPLLILITTGCKYAGKEYPSKLVDTIAAIRKLTDYKPLEADEAYAFINKYYLPRLDTMPTGRKILNHPLVGYDFNKAFNTGKTDLEAEYLSDSNNLKVVILPPEPLGNYDKKQNWDNSRLDKTTIVADPYRINPHDVKAVEAWHKKYGHGYMYLSWPQYNSNTKRLRIDEEIEDANWCGTGKRRSFSFTKVGNTWIAD